MSLRGTPNQTDNVNVTSATTLLRRQSGSHVHNKGATGAVTVSLPTGSQAGDQFEFTVKAAFSLVVAPTDAGDFITLGGVAGSAGPTHNVSVAVAGDHIKLLNIGGGEWMVIDVIGTWVAA